MNNNKNAGFKVGRIYKSKFSPVQEQYILVTEILESSRTFATEQRIKYKSLDMPDVFVVEFLHKNHWVETSKCGFAD